MSEKPDNQNINDQVGRPLDGQGQADTRRGGPDPVFEAPPSEIYDSRAPKERLKSPEEAQLPLESQPTKEFTRPDADRVQAAMPTSAPTPPGLGQHGDARPTPTPPGRFPQRAKDVPNEGRGGPQDARLRQGERVPEDWRYRSAGVERPRNRNSQRLRKAGDEQASPTKDRKRTLLIVSASVLVVLLAILAAALYYRTTISAPRREAEQAIMKLYSDQSKTAVSDQLNEEDLAYAELLVNALPDSEFRSDSLAELATIRHCLYLMQVRDAYAAEERSYAELSPDQLDQALSRAQSVATPLDDLIVQELHSLREEYRTWETVSGEVQLYGNDPLLFYNAEQGVATKLGAQIESLGREVDRTRLNTEYLVLLEYRVAYQKLQSYNDPSYDLSEVDVDALQSEMLSLSTNNSKLFIPLAGVWAKLEIQIQTISEIEQSFSDAYDYGEHLRSDFSDEDYSEIEQMINSLVNTGTKSAYRTRLNEIRQTLDDRKREAEEAQKAELQQRRDEILNKVFTPDEAAELLYWLVHDTYPADSDVDLAYYEPNYNLLTGRWDLQIVEHQLDHVVTVQWYSMDLTSGLAYDSMFAINPPVDLHQLLLKQEGIPDSAPSPTN